MSKIRFRRIFSVVCCIVFLSGAVPVARAQDAKGTQEVSFEGFEFKLPARFEEVPVPAGKLPDFLRLKPFQVKKDGDVVEASMIVRNSLPQVVQESEKDFDKSVNNFLAGLMRQQQLTLGKPKIADPFEWNGHQVKKYTYKATLPTGSDALLVAFAFLHDDAFVCLTHVNYASDNAKPSLSFQEACFGKKPAKAKQK